MNNSKKLQSGDIHQLLSDTLLEKVELEQADTERNVFSIPNELKNTIELEIINAFKEWRRSQSDGMWSVNFETLHGKMNEYMQALRASAAEGSFYHHHRHQNANTQVESHCCTTGLLLIISVLTFLLIGIAYFCVFGDLNLVDSLYIIVITFTTVGYGIGDDLQTTETQVFMIFYVMIGVCLIYTGVAFYLENSIEKMMSQHQTTYYNHEDSVSSDTSGFVDQLKDRVFLDDGSFKFGYFVLIWVIVLFGGAYVMAHIEDWTFVEGMYFAVISGSTVGFGDYEPDNETAKLLIIFYLPILNTCTAVMFTHVFSSAVETYIGDQFDQFKIEARDMLTIHNFEETLAKMDVDGDGELSEAEFMLQALINDANISREKLLFLKARFSELDVDGSGSINILDFHQLLLRDNTDNKRQPNTSITFE